MIILIMTESSQHWRPSLNGRRSYVHTTHYCSFTWQFLHWSYFQTHSTHSPLKMECGYLHSEVIHNSHTQSSHPMDCTWTCTFTGVGPHSGWPSECSDEERYNSTHSYWLHSISVYYTEMSSMPDNVGQHLYAVHSSNWFTWSIKYA